MIVTFNSLLHRISLLFSSLSEIMSHSFIRNIFLYALILPNSVSLCLVVGWLCFPIVDKWPHIDVLCGSMLCPLRSPELCSVGAPSMWADYSGCAR